MDKVPVPPGWNEFSRWRICNCDLLFCPKEEWGMFFFAMEHCARTIVVENLRYTAGTPCRRCAKSAIDLISKARYDFVSPPFRKFCRESPVTTSWRYFLSYRLVNWWNSKSFFRSLRGMKDNNGYYCLETLPRPSNPLVIFSCVFRVGIDIRFHWSGFDSDTARYRWIIEVIR